MIRISGIRVFENLPVEAQRYVNFAEDGIGCPITYVSVGPERDSMIVRRKKYGEAGLYHYCSNSAKSFAKMP